MAKAQGGDLMDVIRLRKDVQIVVDLDKQGAIRGADWSVDGKDNWIIMYGGAKLPPGKFNFPDVNIKLPIPANLYDPMGGGKFHFYRTIFIDSRLRRNVGGKLRPIARQMPNMNATEAGKGWSFLCVYPHAVREEADIRALIPIVQRWIMGNGGDI